MGPVGHSGQVIAVMPQTYLSSLPISIPGPEAASYLQGLTSFDLRQLTFGKSAFIPIEGFNLHVARGGYTGEDGFEVNFCDWLFVT